MAYFFSGGLIPSPLTTAGQLVDLCKGFYTPSFWRSLSIPGGIGGFHCETMSGAERMKPTTAGSLFEDFICESGPASIEFNGSDVLTRKLADSLAIHRVRARYYTSGGIQQTEEKFGSLITYLMEYRDLRIHGGEFPIVEVLGSFDVAVSSAENNRIKFWVHNRMDLASGTHLVGRFPPEGQRENPLSIEEVVSKNPSMRDLPAWWLIATYSDPHRGNIVSVLRPVSRALTPTGFGGGIFEQTFLWSEKDISCQIQSISWPTYLPLLDIGMDG